jgi:hypothetical protein
MKPSPSVQRLCYRWRQRRRGFELDRIMEWHGGRQRLRHGQPSATTIGSGRGLGELSQRCFNLRAQIRGRVHGKRSGELAFRRCLVSRLKKGNSEVIAEVGRSWVFTDQPSKYLKSAFVLVLLHINTRQSTAIPGCSGPLGRLSAQVARLRLGCRSSRRLDKLDRSLTRNYPVSIPARAADYSSLHVFGPQRSSHAQEKQVVRDLSGPACLPREAQ